MQTLIIINPAAAKAKRFWPVIEEQLRSAGIQHELYETSRAGDATNKTRNALNSGTTNVVVVGGDGTLSEAAEGFFEFSSDISQPPKPINPNAALGIVPAGTGNDFAGGLRGRNVELTVWTEALISHLKDSQCAKTIDVLYGKSDGYHRPFICLNASTMGIGGETANRVQNQRSFMRRFSGEFRFLYAALGALAVWRERRVRVTVDGRELIDGPMNLVAVLNGLYAGGGMMLSPEATLDDGRLDVVTASRFGRAGIMRELARVHDGGHIANPKVGVTEGQIVKIETFMAQDAMPIEVDGNLCGVTPVQFEVLPGALKIAGAALRGRP
jgi:YegS/Rv2252/BmrU family lipid kinase